MGDPEVELVHSCRATEATARRMAWATLGFTLRSRKFLVQTAAMPLLFIVLFVMLAGGDGVALIGGLYGVVLLALVITLTYLVSWSAISYVTNYRNFRRALPAGSLQRTGFGAEGFALANHLGASQVSYGAVQSVGSYGGFVFIRLVGQPAYLVVPQELCPVDAMSRLQQATSQDRHHR